jgi:hypothetical protein
MNDRPTMTIREIMTKLRRGRTFTYHWIRSRGLERVPWTSKGAPLYWRDEVEAAHAGPASLATRVPAWATMTDAEMERMAEWSDLMARAENGVDWQAS